jgi:PAS domain S-box-containing protein
MFIETFKKYPSNKTGGIKIEKRKNKPFSLTNEAYYNIFNNMQEIMAIFEIIRDENNNPVDMIIRDINNTYVQNFGIPREKIINQHASDFYGKEFVDNYFNLTKKDSAIRHGKKFETYFPPLNKHFLTSLFPIGENLYITLSIDITERKQMEEELKEYKETLEEKIEEHTKKLKETNQALKESEKKFKEIFNKANDMISLNEMNEGLPGKFIEVNEVGFKRLGYTREEMLNMGPKDIVAPEKRAEMPENAAILIENGCNTFEIVHLTKDGKKIPIEVNNHLINYKGHKVCLAISRDITERKRMEVALVESEKKFREIFNRANDMITLGELRKDGLPGKYIEVNEVGLKRLGYTKEEFLEMNPLDIIADERKKDVAKYAAEIWTKGHATFEMVHITKTGTKIPVEINTHIFKKNDKNVILAISRDITERKKSEEKLKELLEKLSTSNEELEQFAYITSHDLQEPLRTIASFTQLLQRRYKGKFDSDADEFMEYIVDASVRMKEMIHDLLEYSRVSTSEEELEPLNLNKVLLDVLNDLKFTIKENNAEIIHDKLPTVIGDYDQISRVFLNFINNAIKFKKDEKPPKIKISAVKDEKRNEYIISVKDNGIGMEPQYAERIFVIFQRLHSIAEYKGSGIGLAITKRIIEKHGGGVWVESKLGFGSTFYFTLPVPSN